MTTLNPWVVQQPVPAPPAQSAAPVARRPLAARVAAPALYSGLALSLVAYAAVPYVVLTRLLG